MPYQVKFPYLLRNGGTENITHRLIFVHPSMLSLCAFPSFSSIPYCGLFFYEWRTADHRITHQGVTIRFSASVYGHHSKLFGMQKPTTFHLLSFKLWGAGKVSVEQPPVQLSTFASLVRYHARNHVLPNCSCSCRCKICRS